ncbi:MAG: HTH domain-containing protein, partial [Clostridia bacterium]|nr:HTH domain-containing protein [Clostridia bacterium]
VYSVVNPVVNEPLTNDEKMLIKLLEKDATLSAKKMALVLNKSDRSVQRLLEKLKDKGALERIGSTKGYWKVKEHLS